MIPSGIFVKNLLNSIVNGAGYVAALTHQLFK